MKKISILFTLFLSITVFLSCSNTKTYAQLQDEEEALIQSYIKQNNITVVNTMPQVGEWKENEYYKSSSGLYFHLVSPTSPKDTADYDKVKLKSKIFYRSASYMLEGDTLQVTFSTTQYLYPESLIVGDYTSSISALQEAVQYMRFKGSEAKIIIPHSLNTTSFQQSVTPLGYHIKITGIN